MLQQTTVVAVVPYFERWMARFPTVESLASAMSDDVLAAWQGLGYYRRARNLHATAALVVKQGWPSDLAGWRALPGVGAYTAGAVCSIALGLRVPAVDANVTRVAARVSGGRTPAADWARDLVQCARPGDINQALMDLGATVCKAKSWACDRCPLAMHCVACGVGEQHRLPAQTKRKATIEVQEFATVYRKGAKFGVQRFEEGKWWAGMYGFARSHDAPCGENIGTVRHTVTHHKIRLSVHLSETSQKGLLWKSVDELERLPMPTPDRKALRLAVQAIGSKPAGTARLPSSAKK